MRQEIGNRLEEAALSIVNYLTAQKPFEMKNTCSFILPHENGSHKTIQFIEQGIKKVTCFTQNVMKAGEGCYFKIYHVDVAS